MKSISVDSIANLIGVDDQHTVAGALIVFGFVMLLVASFSLLQTVRLRRSRLIEGYIKDFAYTSITQTCCHTNLVVDAILPSGKTKRFQDRSDASSLLFTKGQAVPVWYHERSGQMSVALDPNVAGHRFRTGMQWFIAGAFAFSGGILLVIYLGPVFPK